MFVVMWLAFTCFTNRAMFDDDPKNITYRYTVQPWELELRLLMLVGSLPNLRETLCHVSHANHTHGGVT